MATSDSPLVMPAKKFSADQKEHRLNGSALEQFSQVIALGTVPIGGIIAFGGTTPPAGYLLCNGAAISRTTYAALFSVIGTTYGAGDGSTTFNIPNIPAIAGAHTHGGVTAGSASTTSTGTSVNWLIRTGAV